MKSEKRVVCLLLKQYFEKRAALDHESEKAKKVRNLILDFVITTINEKTGGGTKYINRRDVNYLPAAITEENYRKNLTSAINQYVDGHHTYKYSQITDFIYKAVFKENAKGMMPGPKWLQGISVSGMRIMVI